MRTRIKGMIERRLDVRIIRDMPPGFDLYHDLKGIPSWSSSGVILDVGANVGQTALDLSAEFPEAQIHAFEPAPTTFDQLRRRTEHLANVRRFNFAFGAERGSAQMLLHRKPDQNTLREDLSEAPGFEGQGHVTVDVRTVDDFVAEQDIGFVQFLKIDTEGYDLEVLRGADAALSAGKIGVVEVEAGFLQDEGKFIPLETFRSHLRERSYLLFGIYEQVRVQHRTRLRRCNAVFISEAFAG